LELRWAIQSLRDVHTARTRPRKPDDLLSAIAVRHRLPKLHTVPREVRHAEQPAVLLHPALGCLSESAAIKPVEPFLRNMTVSASELRLFQQLPFAISRTIGMQKNAPRFIE